LVEKQAAFKKRLADLERVQQVQGVEGVPPVVPANVPAHACELLPRLVSPERGEAAG